MWRRRYSQQHLLQKNHRHQQRCRQTTRALRAAARADKTRARNHWLKVCVRGLNKQVPECQVAWHSRQQHSRQQQQQQQRESRQISIQPGCISPPLHRRDQIVYFLGRAKFQTSFYCNFYPPTNIDIAAKTVCTAAAIGVLRSASASADLGSRGVRCLLLCTLSTSCCEGRLASRCLHPCTHFETSPKDRDRDKILLFTLFFRREATDNGFPT